ncbi:hypothetical protein LJR084_007550 [Variovorax sp. LjRoot84]|uniref:hypothetical protein n=1 Tax=Variovorax sp. LjRoot84 TaxID=3342340 RepID=UPI003ED0348B
MLQMTREQSEYEVRFESLFKPGRGFAFPCDQSGRLDLDRASEAARNNYFFARAMVGREFSPPVVRPLTLH